MIEILEKPRWQQSKKSSLWKDVGWEILKIDMIDMTTGMMIAIFISFIRST